MSSTDIQGAPQPPTAPSAEAGRERVGATQARAVSREEVAESVGLAADVLATLRSAQVDTTERRGDLGTFTGVYSLVLIVALGGLMLWSALRGAGFHLDRGAFIADPRFVAVGTWLMALGVCVMTANAAGPLGASKPMRSWLLNTPADRAVLLRSPLRASTAVGAVLLASAGAFAAAMTQSHAMLVVSGTALGFTAGALVVRVLAVLQPRPDSQVTAATAGSVAVAAGALTLVLGVLPGWSTVSQLQVPSSDNDVQQVVRDVVLLLLALGATWRLQREVRRSSRQIRIGALSRGGDFVDALGISTIMLDSTPLRGVLSPPPTRRRRIRGLRRRGLAALVEVDVLSASRRQRTGLLLMASLPLPATTAAMFGSNMGWLVAVLLAYGIAHVNADGLTRWTRSDSLRRELPFPDWKARLALLVTPFIAAGVWAALALPLARVSLTLWPVLIAAVMGATVRAARPRDTASAATGMLATPMGVVPVGLIMVLFKGVDVLLVPGVLAAVGLPLPAFVVAAVTAVGLILRGR